MMTKNTEHYQVTETGDKTILVHLRDKVTGEYVSLANIKRSKLAKYYHEQRVTHVINGVPVVDI